jgi:hypothetical protein
MQLGLRRASAPDPGVSLLLPWASRLPGRQRPAPVTVAAPRAHRVAYFDLVETSIADSVLRRRAAILGGDLEGGAGQPTAH